MSPTSATGAARHKGTFPTPPARPRRFELAGDPLDGFSLVELMAAIAVMMGLLLIGSFMWWSTRDAAQATVAQTAIQQVAFVEQNLYRRFGSFEANRFVLEENEPGYRYLPQSRQPTEISVEVGTDLESDLDVVGIAAADGTADGADAGTCYLYKLFPPGSGRLPIAQTMPYGGDTGTVCEGAAALSLEGASTWGLDSE